MTSKQRAIGVIHEERDFLVLDKPAGVSVHRGASMVGETVTDWLLRTYPEVKTVGDDPEMRPGIVHRLDKDTSGVLIVARNQPAFEALKRLFQRRQVEKIYLALVLGVPSERSGAIETPIGRLARHPTKRGVGAKLRGARAAITRYRVLERFDGYALLRVRPHTGRMHQIRVHLKSIGHPVAGDRVYGGMKASLLGLDRQFLHASSLEFSYPEGRRLRFESPLPPELNAVLKELRKQRRRGNISSA